MADSKNKICTACNAENKPEARTCAVCGMELPDREIFELKTEVKTDAPPMLGNANAGALFAGRYQVLRILGKGGMGEVLLARDQLLGGREVALKMIAPELVQSPEAVKRFAQEVIAAQSLSHENIVKVFDLKEEAGRHLFTMEYVPGKSLREVLEERKDAGKAFSLSEALGVMLPILSALEHAHARGVVHRDLKPDNIMRGERGQAGDIRVVDFGLARLLTPSRMTTSAISMGTAYYMSPEQLGGSLDVGPASDLYSVGVIFYELLTGQIPTGRFKLPCEIVDGLPPEVDEIIDRAMQQKPEDRFANTTAMRQALAALEPEAEPEQTPAHKPVAPQKPQRAATSVRPPSAAPTGGGMVKKLLAAVVVVAVLGGGVFGYLWWQKKGEEEVKASVAGCGKMLTSGKLLEAQKCYRAVLASDSGNYQARQGLSRVASRWLVSAGVHEREGKLAQARVEYERALDLEPGNVKAQEGLQRVRLAIKGEARKLAGKGREALKERKAEDAVRLFKLAASQDPESEAARNGLEQSRAAVKKAESLATQGTRELNAKRLGQAIASFEKALACNTQNREAAEGHAVALSGKGKSEGLAAAGGKYLKARELAKALESYQEALAAWPGNAQASNGLKASDEELSQYGTLIAEGEKLLKAGKAGDAVGKYRSARGVYPGGKEWKHGLVAGLVELGAGAVKSGKVVMAKKYLQEALSLSPRDAEAGRYLAAAFVKEGEGLLSQRGGAEAVKSFASAMKHDPENNLAKAGYVKAVALAKRQREEKEKKKKKASLLVAEGDRLYKQLLVKSAQAKYREALQYDPSNGAARVGAKRGLPKVFTNSIGMKFVLIPAGSFLMGSKEGEVDERPVHRVTITKPFYMQTTEVTQGQWKAVMGSNPSGFKECGDRCPVEMVSWDEAQAFVRRLSDRDGRKYVLPTEAQWEYAARAGSNTAYSFGNDAGRLGEYAWYDGNSGSKTHPVATCKPNRWGIYDMHGNVWEWVRDWFGSYSGPSSTDPTGPSSGAYRVIRGGGWVNFAELCHSAYRNRKEPGDRNIALGFRLAAGR